MKQEIFNSAVRRNSQRLYLIALSYTHNNSDAEDILQNVFLKLWDCKKPFEDNTHMDKWLTCVTVNECKNLLKSPFHGKNQTADDLADSFEFHEERDIDLFRAVMKLSKKESAAVHLFYYEDLSVEEIAVLLKIKPSAVKTRLCRARKELKELLGDEWNNE